MKKLFFLVFLLLIPLVIAQPPTQTNVNLEKGIQVFYPAIEFIQIEKPFTFHVHAVNITDGKPLNNTGVNCTLHLYNHTGNQVLDMEMVKESNFLDHELFVKKGNFTQMGLVPWSIYCVTDGIGGDISGAFEVTATGQGNTTSHSLLYILLLGVYVLALGLTIWGTSKLPTEDLRSEEGLLIKISWLKYLRPLGYGVTYMLLFAIFYTSGLISISFLPNNFLGNALFGMSLIMGYLAVPILIIYVFKLIDLARQDIMNQRLINRGLIE